MQWIMNFKIKQILMGVAMIVVGLLLISGIKNYMNLVAVQNASSEQSKEILPNTFDFLAVEKGIHQIHLWFLDASATRSVEGFDDGLSEAKKAFDETNRHLDSLIQAHTQAHKQIW